MASLTARLVTIHLALAACLSCSSQAIETNPVTSGSTRYTPDQVRVVDEAGFEALRKAGTHDIRGPLGEITGTASCSSGSADEQCVEAARQRLREGAAARGANLVVVVGSAMAQSFPPQYSATGALYEITERR